MAKNFTNERCGDPIYSQSWRNPKPYRLGWVGRQGKERDERSLSKRQETPQALVSVEFKTADQRPHLIMLTLKPLDESCPIHQQLGADVSPVVLVNLFTVAAPDVAALLQAWEADANWMKQQPGYISTQLHRAVGESCVFLNYAVWESVAHFKAAFGHPDFRAALGAYPSSVVASPHLFEKIAVPNLCTR